ncbi:MAG: phage portal protein, partial [Syntrophus sp. (in: bacteria)]
KRPMTQAAGFLKIVDARGDRIPIRALAGEYEGAATGRRMSTWGTSTKGPNTALYSSLNRLRARSREVIRNNPLMDGGVDTFVANLIGSGISPRWQLNDKNLKKQIQELWSDWTEEADFNNLCDFYGLQSLVSRALIDAGECLVKVIPAYPGDNVDLTVPLQLQVIEADHLDETYNTIASNGNEIRMGIEIDKSGRRQAYWLWKDHPGEAFITQNNMDRIRVPASEILHIFRPLRAGQMRGRPWLSSIIVKLHELDQYEDAELVRKKCAAMFGGFIYEESSQMGDPGAWMGRTGTVDSNESDIVALEPGTFPVLPQGKKVEFSKPVDVGTTYEPWIKQQLREIAAGWGITYEQLTGDLSGVNYSSIRAGLLEFRRRCSMLQTQALVFQLCRPVSRFWMDAAVLSGALDIQGYFPNRRIYRRIKWRPDGWPWVDPVKDQLAQQMAVRNGFKSRAKVIAEMGDDIEVVDAEIAEDNDRADKMGLIYDTDPRNTAKTGAMQTAADDASADPATPNGGKSNVQE